MQCLWGMRKLLCEQANLQNWTWNAALWESSSIATGWKAHSMVCSQSCQPRTEVSWWESLPRLYFQHKQKDDDSSAPWTDKPLTHLREIRGKEIKNPHFFTMSPNTSFVSEEVGRPPPQEDRHLEPLGHLPAPECAQTRCGSLPCTHPGLHPTGCPHSPRPLFGRARDNSEAAKRICVKGSSSRKTLGRKKETGSGAKAPGNLK